MSNNTIKGLFLFSASSMLFGTNWLHAVEKPASVIPRWIIPSADKSPSEATKRYHVLVLSANGNAAQVAVQPLTSNSSRFLIVNLVNRLSSKELIGTPLEEFYYEQNDPVKRLVIPDKLHRLRNGKMGLIALKVSESLDYDSVVQIQSRSKDATRSFIKNRRRRLGAL